MDLLDLASASTSMTDVVGRAQNVRATTTTTTCFDVFAAISANATPGHRSQEA
jgi:hypothetical protein